MWRLTGNRAAHTSEQPQERRRRQRARASAAELPHQRSWIAWVVALAALAAVVLVATHAAEERQLVDLLQKARPAWLLMAVGLQACTYLCQASIWRLTLERLGEARSLAPLYRLSLAQLFIDQAIPSGAASGSIFIAKALSDRGVSRSTVSSAILASAISYYASYVLALVVALLIFAGTGKLNREVAWVAGIFIGLASIILVGMLVLGYRGFPQSLPLVSRFRIGRRLLGILSGVDARQVMTPALLTTTTALQGAIFILDAASLWAALAAMGSPIAPYEVFAAFMLASLGRTMGIVPGGLGTFEAVAIGTLAFLGVPVASALAATILFRGLSFWLPMLPGMLFARREARRGRGVSRAWRVPL